MAINILSPRPGGLLYRVYFGAGSSWCRWGIDADPLRSCWSITSTTSCCGCCWTRPPWCIWPTAWSIYPPSTSTRPVRTELQGRGEYPKGGATWAISVVGVKYAASGHLRALAGIGGAYLTTCYSTPTTDGKCGDGASIALAAVIFGR